MLLIFPHFLLLPEHACFSLRKFQKREKKQNGLVLGGCAFFWHAMSFLVSEGMFFLVSDGMVLGVTWMVSEGEWMVFIGTCMAPLVRECFLAYVNGFSQDVTG